MKTNKKYLDCPEDNYRQKSGRKPRISYQAERERMSVKRMLQISLDRVESGGPM